ncbi:MAG: circadian clock protein KaiA [Synechococcus sp.]
MKEPDLVIGSLIATPQVRQACGQWLQDGRYALQPLPLGGEGWHERIVAAWEGLDGLLIEQNALDPPLLSQLRQEGLLPTVVIGAVTGEVTWHEAEVHLQADQLEQLPYVLDAAVSRFLERRVLRGEAREGNAPEQWRLSRRLEDRLGYLGVFYKRDPALFLRHLPAPEQAELLRSLERSYRDVLLSYFRDPPAANQAIESYVNTAFFSDLPITRTVEIHMNLIDGWSKQLRLEGHKSDFLQDYRLALLDVMAHLCEMYRRSIPPEVGAGPSRLPARHRRQEETP